MVASRRDANCWNARCEPPWSERELLAKLEHARRYGREPIGGRRDLVEAGHKTGPGNVTDCPGVEVRDHPATDNAEADGHRVLHGKRACEGLAAAHAAGLVHRDFKPDNVLLGADGRVRVTDFGLARAVRAATPPPISSVDSTEAAQTRAGVVMGTPAYMAPEQARGEPKSVGPHSDVYALGVILYELLTERLPFEFARTTPVDAEQSPERPSLAAVKTAGPASKAPRHLSADLDVLCLTAMHSDRQRRYASTLLDLHPSYVSSAVWYFVRYFSFDA